MKEQNNFFKELEKRGIAISETQKRMIQNKLNSVLSYEPKIGIFGKTGVGKSSLCNALFGQDVCEISNVEACTRNPQEVIIGMGTKGLKLIDVPGVGESEERDKEYYALYKKLLPELDLVLWVLKGDDRAFASDEKCYKKIIEPHIEEGKVFFFVLNQVDKIEPYKEWDTKKRDPGVNQFKNIYKKVADVSKTFCIAESKIIPVSAGEKYNITRLVDEIVFALPKEKKITLFNEVVEENKSEKAHKEVKKSFLQVVGDTVSDVVEAVGTVVKKIGDIVSKIPLPIPGRLSSGCFITTATCKFLNKPDDCYELTMFREFRDNWLALQPNGENLIKEYYKVAPIIVDKINESSNKNEIYNNIWKDYLSKCLKLIEAKEYEECKNLYINMVNNLKEVSY